MTLAEFQQPQLPASDSVPLAPRRLRVLMSAYYVSPLEGSEPAVGWNIPTRVAKYHDVTLLCNPGADNHFRRDTLNWIAQHDPVPGLTLHWVEPTRLSRAFDADSSSIRRLFHYVGYASWQRAALREAWRLHRERPFDLVHQLNVVTFREPSYLWKLPIPFVWGPIAGASNMPWRYFRLLGAKDRLVYGLRNIANEIQKRTNRRARRAARAAQRIWVVSRDNEQLVTRLWRRPCEYLPEVGTTPRAEAGIKSWDGVGPLRLVWSGYHVGRKAIPIILRAMAQLRSAPGLAPVHLAILGDGPQRTAWQQLAGDLGVTDQVWWLGQLPHAEAIAQMSKAHVFVFPSLQEASSTVVLEALSLGLPVVCHDACGMGLVVNESCGIKVPMRSADESVRGFSDAIEHLRRSPAEIRCLSGGALSRGAELSWDNKARRIAETFTEIVAAAASPSAGGLA